MGNLMSIIAFWDTPPATGQASRPQAIVEPAFRPIERIDSNGTKLSSENVFPLFNHSIDQCISSPMPTDPASAQTTFNKVIQIYGGNDEGLLATALLDTQCHVGNWISKRLVQRLGQLSSISSDFVPFEVFDASGQSILARGVINLAWRWHPHGCRFHECQFYVLPDSSHLDILFGVEYIVSEKLLVVNESAFAPLVEHKKASKGGKAAIASAKRRQQEEKAALAERRKEAEHKAAKKGSSQKGESQHGGSRQGEQ